MAASPDYAESLSSLSSLTSLPDSDISDENTLVPAVAPAAKFVPKHYPGLEISIPREYNSPYEPLPQSEKTPRASFFSFPKKQQNTNTPSPEQQNTPSPVLQRATRAALRRNREQQQESLAQAIKQLQQPSNSQSRIQDTGRGKGKSLYRESSSESEDSSSESQDSNSEDEHTSNGESDEEFTHYPVQAPPSAERIPTRAKFVRRTDPEQVAAAFRARYSGTRQSTATASDFSDRVVDSHSPESNVPQQQIAAELALTKLLLPVLSDIVALIHDQTVLVAISKIYLPSFQREIKECRTHLKSFCTEIVEIIQDPGKAFGTKETNSLLVYHAILGKFEGHWTAIMALLTTMEKAEGGLHALYPERKSRFKLLRKASQPGSIKNNGVLKTNIAARHAADLREKVMRVRDTMCEV